MSDFITITREALNEILKELELIKDASGSNVFVKNKTEKLIKNLKR